MQLTKAQTHANVMQFYGYYFYETMYNTYRIALVCEYIDQKHNLEALFRKRKQQGKHWKLFELERIAASLISALSYLQTIGVCHRDIKPANLFLLPNCVVKIIDFGESKNFFLEKNISENPNLATIRGTPQYLSPILWKAHVVDGITRQVEHDMYKSDVFSAGLVLTQLAMMDDVTGFNQKSHGANGEKLIEQAVAKLAKSYSRTLCEMLRLMLKFSEAERPDFVQLAERFLDKSESEAKLKRLEGDVAPAEEPESWQAEAEDPDKSEAPEELKSRGRKENVNPSSLGSKKLGIVLGTLPDQGAGKKQPTLEESTEQLMSQNELFKAYAKSNDLFVNVTENAYWFEYGGNGIGEFNVKRAEGKWKVIGKYKDEFSSHFVLVFAEAHGFFLLGPNTLGTCLQYKSRRLNPKQNMPQLKSFFCGTFLGGNIYTFGGYDSAEKLQLKTCEIYNVAKDHWKENSASLNQARSQAAVCAMNKNLLYIFGGYNKQEGTLASIEKFSIKEGTMKLLKLSMPNPLRRFSAIKIAPSKILLLGGLQKLGKESDAVYCVDFEEQETIEKLDKLGKGGVIESPIILDEVGNLHLFIENCSGTAPPFHISYTFLEYS